MQEKTNPTHGLDSEEEPLSMTVYDLPSPSNLAQEDATRTRKGRLLMIIVLLICASPVVMSYLTYYVIRPSSIRSFGELVQPTRAIPSLNVEVITKPSAETRKLENLQSLKGQWLLINVSTSGCEQACQESLYFQRQIHTALGREKDRVDRVWLIADDKSPAPELVQAVGESWVIKANAQELAKWFGIASQSSMNEHMYLVDPMGELMMQFPAHIQIDTAPKIRRDIERVLRASESWDLPGRNDLPKHDASSLSNNPSNPTTDNATASTKP
jgi:cytochrome oxidase Cu insertion factor (SCO1/SenC/PrrC family)